MEYLLTHGPEQFIMDFREDKKRIEELTRCVFVDAFADSDTTDETGLSKERKKESLMR